MSQSYRAGVARLFWSRAKFEDYFSSWTALFEITDFNVTISAKQKKIAFIDQISHNIKRAKGRKNKLEGRTLSMSAIENVTDLD